MSLVGNLEDLGLGDILQIVSLSRKSGELVLQSQNREGKVIFQNGQVTRATSTVFRDNLGDLLIRRGVVDIDIIKNALQIQRTTNPPQRLGAILSEKFDVKKETIDSIVRGQIEKIVYSFFAWNEGTFAFDLGESDEVAATHFDPLQFMLDQGLNPQWLAMEGSRILDEKLHRGESLEEEVEAPLIDVANLLGYFGECESAPGQRDQMSDSLTNSAQTLFFVDDDEVTRLALADVLSHKGFCVKSFSDADVFMQELEKTVSIGSEPLLLIDLLMPRQDGSGVLGGLELVERIKIAYPGLNILVISDHLNTEAERRIAEIGLPRILIKPKKVDVREAHGLLALEALGEKIFLTFNRGGSSIDDRPATFNLGVEMRLEFGEKAESQRLSRGPESPGLFLLRGMLQELNNPALGGGITLLVLRFASELMNRAVIFLVKEDEIVGLGQFGIESVGGELADVRIRNMKIPRNEGSLFEEVLREWIPMKLKLGKSPWDNYLVEQLGGKSPNELFLGPIISEGKVVAILYGDNVPEKKLIGDTESLEIFLSQAGLAMEKALLERRLRNRESTA